MWRRRRMLEELDEDIRDHIARETQDNIERGMSPEEARYAAMRKFGNVMSVKEETREVWSVAWLEQVVEDMRFGLRLLRKNPGFTAVAVLTLALGIGANAAVFSVVYAVLLRPLPYKDPSSLIVLNETTPMVGTVSVSYPNFLDWRSQSRTFSEMAAVRGVGFNLAGVTQPENISGGAVSPNFLSMMGVRPFLGRDFEASEEKAGTPPVLLLSYSLWQSHFGGDPNIVGRTIKLDDRSFTIVGVLPPNYRSLDKTDVMLPIGVWATGNPEDVKERGARGDLVVIGRLATGVSLAKARAEMEGIAARLANGISGEQRSVWRGAPADSRRIRRRHKAGNPGAFWCGGVRAADRVRECGEPVSRSRGEPHQGNCVAHCVWRQPRPHRRPNADREFCFGASRRRLRPGARRRRDSWNVAADSGGHVVRRYCESERRGAAVCGGRGDTGCFYFWLGASLAFDQA